MRSYYAGIFKKYFYQDLIHARTAMHLTQQQMAELLKMGVRSYIDLDQGKNSCSGLTLAIYLVYCCPDPVAFLDGLCSVLEENEDHTHRRSEDLHVQRLLSYHQPLSVTRSIIASDRKLHPVCPRCARTLEHENMRYCSNCGQKLIWHQYRSPRPQILH